MSIQPMIDHLQALCDECPTSTALLIEDIIDAVMWFGADPIAVHTIKDGIFVEVQLSNGDNHKFILTMLDAAKRPLHIDYFAITRSMA